jgi:hypothetical protein
LHWGGEEKTETNKQTNKQINKERRRKEGRKKKDAVVGQSYSNPPP